MLEVAPRPLPRPQCRALGGGQVSRGDGRSDAVCTEKRWRVGGLAVDDGHVCGIARPWNPPKTANPPVFGQHQDSVGFAVPPRVLDCHRKTLQ